LITSAGQGADPGFLAVSPQATVINLVLGRRYFPPGLMLFSQPKISLIRKRKLRFSGHQISWVSESLI